MNKCLSLEAGIGKMVVDSHHGDGDPGDVLQLCADYGILYHGIRIYSHTNGESSDTEP